VTGVTRPSAACPECFGVLATALVASSYAKDAVAADPDQPVISACPASFKGVIPPGVTGVDDRAVRQYEAFLAVGCAVRWLTERRPDPHNCEREYDEDRDDNFAPHGATITTAAVRLVTPCGNSVRFPDDVGGCTRRQ